MRVRMAAKAMAGARVPPVRATATRAFAGRGYVLASGMLYVSAEVPLFGTGTAGAQAVLYPFDKLFHGQVTAGASATAELVRIRQLAGSASTHTTVASAPTNFIRQGFAHVSAGVSDAIGNPDTTVGGVRHAELGTRSRAGVTAEVTIDPTKALHGTGQIRVRALPAKAPSRTIMLKSTGNLVLSAAKATLHADVTLQGVPVRAGAVAAHAPLYRTTFLSAHATAGADGQGQVSALRYLGGRGTGGADAKADPIRIRGLRGQVQAGASAAHTKLKMAEKLAGRASVHVDAAAPGYFTTRTMHAQPTMVTCTAQPGDIKVNLYAREPDFRTLIVEPGDWLHGVDPQDWTLFVKDDTTPMKTFEKQPADVLAYDIDFTEWFEQIPRDEIQTLACVVDEATDGDATNLAVDSVVKVSSTQGGPAKIAKVWVSGGLNAVTYKLTLTMVSEGGRTKEIDFKMKVRDK